MDNGDPGQGDSPVNGKSGQIDTVREKSSGPVIYGWYRMRERGELNMTHF